MLVDRAPIFWHPRRIGDSHLAESGHHFLADVEVGEDVLDIVVVFEDQSMKSVRVQSSDRGLHFEAELVAVELGGILTIDVGPTVTVGDVLLRR